MTQSLPVVRTMVEVETGAMRGYLARPAGTGRYPGVLLGHQLFGVDAPARAFAERLAGCGYTVLVPDFYHRVAPDPAVPIELPHTDEGRRRGFDLLRQLSADSVLADAGAALRYLVKEAGPGTAMVGLSIGAHFAYLAATELDLAATVAFYPGWLTSTELPFAQDRPTVARTPGMARHGGRLLLLTGADDHVVPGADRQTIAEALRTAGVRHELVVYPGTPHAFLLPGADTYRPEPAADAWRRTLAVLAEELAG
jgi:carboxymethylenebutenolidase